MLSVLISLFVIFNSFLPGVFFYKNMNDIVVHDVLYYKVNQIAEKQKNIFTTNNIDLDLSPVRKKPIGPSSVKNSKIEVPVTSSIAIDLISDYGLHINNADEVLPIASITKLMTAYVFLEHNPGWETVYKIKDEDRRDGGRVRLFRGDSLTAKDLFYSSLVGSENTAIIGLVNLTGLSEEEFVREMNKKAEEMGLRKTKFADPTGLSTNNTSTAREVYKFSRIILTDDDVRKAVLKKEYNFVTLEGKDKYIESTDDLLSEMPNNIRILGGKTGYLDEVGYCFVGMFEQNGHEVLTVVLGAQNKQDRFTQTKRILNWIFQSYKWNNK